MEPIAEPYLLSIVVPVYNEEDIIAELTKRLQEVVSKLKADDNCKVEIIFVNDGSRDKTLELLCQTKGDDDSISIVNLSRNFGHQIAITAGLDLVKGDAVVVMDGDLQDPPELIPKLIDKWKAGADIVHARRILRHGESSFKRWSAKLYYRLIKELSNVEVPVDVGDFRLMNKRSLDAFRQIRESHRYVRGLVAWVGFNQGFVDFDRDARFAGKTHYSLMKMINLSIHGLVSFSTVPLRLASLLGIFSMLLGFLYFVYVLYAKFVLQSTVLGWTSIVMLVLFMSGTQLVCLGIIGEYVGMISGEIKRRPLYFIEKIY